MELVHSSSAGALSTATQNSRMVSAVILQKLWGDTEQTYQRIFNVQNVKYSRISMVTFPTPKVRHVVPRSWRHSTARRADTSKARHGSSRKSRTERARKPYAAPGPLETLPKPHGTFSRLGESGAEITLSCLAWMKIV